MKTIFKFLLYFLISFSAIAQTRYTVLPKKFPLELELILSFIQDQNLSEQQKEQFQKSLIEIDRYARNLTEEELLFVTKTEVYKTFLKPTSQEPLKKDFYNPQFLNQVRQAKANSQNEPLLRWFLSALEKDLATIFASSEFKDLMLLKSSGKEIPIELLKLERRLDLGIKIALKINSENINELKSLLLEKSLLFLKNLENSYRLLCLYGQYRPLDNQVSLENLQFFKKEEPKTTVANSTKSAQEKPVNKEKSIDQILEPVLTEELPSEKIKIPTPVGEDAWLLDSDLDKITAPMKKDLPRPTAEDDWLTDF